MPGGDPREGVARSAIAHFLSLWEQQEHSRDLDFRDYRRIHTALRAQGPWSLPELRAALAALLVQTPAEEDRFVRLFNEFFDVDAADVFEEGTLTPEPQLPDLPLAPVEPPPPPPPPPVPWYRNSSVLTGIGTLVVVLVLGGLYGYRYFFPPPEAECADGIDNDRDALIDCADSDCFAAEARCRPEVCGNTDDEGAPIDDDGDGFVDCADSDCRGDPFCVESDCGNGIDDDLDGGVDCGDPDCASAAECIESICDDGIDNDADGFTDAEDEDCALRGECADGADNDGDGLVDAADPDCVNGRERALEQDCGDGLDNDGDGRADCADPDCVDSPGCRGEADCGNGGDDDGDGLIDCDDTPDCDDAVECAEPASYLELASRLRNRERSVEGELRVELHEGRKAAWKQASGLSLIVIFLLIGFWADRDDRRKQPRNLDSPTPPDPEGPRRFDIAAIGRRASRSRLSDDDLDDLTRLFGSEELDAESRHLDVEATVHATVDAGGLPTLVHHRRVRAVSLLILVDGGAEARRWNPVPEELHAGLLSRGIAARYGTFFGDPRAFHEGGSLVLLEDLDSLRTSLVILLFSDGRGFLSARDERAGWNPKDALHELSRWPRLAWLDPREPAFWDLGAAVPTARRIPVYEASADGVRRAAEQVLHPDRTGEDDSRLARIPRRGLPPSAAPAVLDRLLGDAAAWACDCAMMQPLPIGVAETLREELHPELPASRIERLYRLPGTVVTVEGLELSDQVLEVLRAGFLRRRSDEEQDQVLRRILDLLDSAAPSDDPGAPSRQRWQLLRERVRMDLEPDEALAALGGLGGTELGGALAADLERVGPAGAALRRAPRSEEARHRLSRLTGKPLPDDLVPGWSAGEMVGISLSIAASLVLVAICAWLIVDSPGLDKTLYLGFVEPGNAELRLYDRNQPTDLARGTGLPSLTRFIQEDGELIGSTWEPLGAVSFGEPTLLPGVRSAPAGRDGEQWLYATADRWFSAKAVPAGRGAITVNLWREREGSLPCWERRLVEVEAADDGPALSIPMVTERCPPVELRSARRGLDLRVPVGDERGELIELRPWTGIGVEIVDSGDPSTFSGLRKRLWSGPSVDAVHRFVWNELDGGVESTRQEAEGDAGSAGRPPPGTAASGSGGPSAVAERIRRVGAALESVYGPWPGGVQILVWTDTELADFGASLADDPWFSAAGRVLLIDAAAADGPWLDGNPEFLAPVFRAEDALITEGWAEDEGPVYPWQTQTLLGLPVFGEGPVPLVLRRPVGGDPLAAPRAAVLVGIEENRRVLVDYLTALQRLLDGWEGDDGDARPCFEEIRDSAAARLAVIDELAGEAAAAREGALLDELVAAAARESERLDKLQAAEARCPLPPARLRAGIEEVTASLLARIDLVSSRIPAASSIPDSAVSDRSRTCYRDRAEELRGLRDEVGSIRDEAGGAGEGALRELYRRVEGNELRGRVDRIAAELPACAPNEIGRAAVLNLIDKHERWLATLDRAADFGSESWRPALVADCMASPRAVLDEARSLLVEARRRSRAAESQSVQEEIVAELEQGRFPELRDRAEQEIEECGNLERELDADRAEIDGAIRQVEGMIVRNGEARGSAGPMTGQDSAAWCYSVVGRDLGSLRDDLTEQRQQLERASSRQELPDMAYFQPPGGLDEELDRMRQRMEYCASLVTETRRITDDQLARFCASTTIDFVPGTAKMEKEARSRLDVLAGLMRNDQQRRTVQVIGYGPASGQAGALNEPADTALAFLRAQAVADYLVLRGVRRTRLDVYTRPLLNNDTDGYVKFELTPEEQSAPNEQAPPGSEEAR